MVLCHSKPYGTFNGKRKIDSFQPTLILLAENNRTPALSINIHRNSTISFHECEKVESKWEVKVERKWEPLERLESKVENDQSVET